MNSSGGTLSFASQGTKATGGVLNFNVSTGTVAYHGATTISNGILGAGYLYGGTTTPPAPAHGSAPSRPTTDTRWSTRVPTPQAANNVKTTVPQSNITASNSFNTLYLTSGYGENILPGQALTLSAGGLIDNGGGNITGGYLNTSSNAELIANYLTSGTISSVIGNSASNFSGPLTLVGTGNLTLTGLNNYIGQTTVDQGMLTLAGGNNTLAVTRAYGQRRHAEPGQQQPVCRHVQQQQRTARRGRHDHRQRDLHRERQRKQQQLRGLGWRFREPGRGG